MANGNKAGRHGRDQSRTRLDAAQQARLLRAIDSHRHGDFAAAEQTYRELLESAPQSFDPLHLLGALSIQKGDLEGGIALLRRAIDVDPGQANAHANLSKALFDRGDAAGALVCADRAVSLDPNYAEAWFNRAAALESLRRGEEAVASYERAVALQPRYAKALNNLGNLLRDLRKPGPALECLDRALALEPQFANALNNRGLVLLELRRAEEALTNFDGALALVPNFAEALNNRGNALMDLQRYADAGAAYEQLAAVAPDFMYVQGNLLHARLQCCDWRDHAPATERLTRLVGSGARADFPFPFLCVSASPDLQLRCAETYTQHQHPPPPVPNPGRRFAHERIRVAYVSGDFGEHAVSYLLAGVLERHDRTQFETIAISWGRQHDGALRRRLEAAFSRFIDVTDEGDAGVAALMQEMEIDIAVDLTGHTRENRTGIFARRAAPVQVNYLGLPATMGAGYIDYLIADRHLIPEDRRSGYAEQVVWLPETFQPNDDRRGDWRVTPRGALGLPEAAVVLCSFNACAKLNPSMFDVWMRVLQAAPGSVLWLLSTNRVVEENLCREAAQRGIARHRLVFAARVDYDEHMSRYANADLFLDSLPFNGGATASDALTLGIPILTCAGESFAARMSSSLLENLGVPELITYSLPDYEAKAVHLARAPEQLARLRRAIAECRRGHAFFDTDRYRRHLESAFRTMWSRNERGLAPAAFAVESPDGAQRSV